MKGGRLLQIANGVIFVLFVSWALLQYNDPDALLWAVAYGVGAMCCLLFFVGRLSPLFGALVATLSLVWALILYYFVISTDQPFTFVDDNVGEMLREAIGLTVVAAWAGVLARIASRKKRMLTS